MSKSAGALAILPVMRTDLKPNRFGTPMLSRNHIYQLYAYVQSQHDRDPLGAIAEGVLLYPVVHADVDEYAVIDGHRYRFLTVDLATQTSAIRNARYRWPQTRADLAAVAARPVCLLESFGPPAVPEGAT